METTERSESQIQFAILMRKLEFIEKTLDTVLKFTGLHPESKMPTRYVSTMEYAKATGLSHRTVIRRCSNGQLKTKPGRRRKESYQIDATELFQTREINGAR